MNTRDLLQTLLQESRELVMAQTDAAFAPYQQALADCDAVYQDCGTARLPAADQLAQLLTLASPQARNLLSILKDGQEQLLWEQSYRQSDNLVPQAMLDGYGFVEFVGKRGPFVTEQVRCGVGIWGPNINYPRHRHAAREIYLVMAGSAEFTVGDTAPYIATAGQAVTVASMVDHGFHTLQQPLAVFYLWQGGDLRETSSFNH